MKYKILNLVFGLFTAFSLLSCENESEDPGMQKLVTPEPEFDQSAIFSSMLTLRWDAIEHAYSYMVRWWKEGDEGNADERKVETTSCTLTRLESMTTYYAQVMACAYEGMEEYNSDYSAVISCSTNDIEADMTPINVSLINALSSTLTFEWNVAGDADLTEEYNYDIALYRDEACTDLVVSWILDRNTEGYGNTVSGGTLFDPYGFGDRFRFTFSGLDAGTDYWVTISADENPAVCTDTPFKATTKTFDYAVTATSNATVGDVLVAQDFHGLIDGGDLANRAAAVITISGLRGTYEVPLGINPTGRAEPTNWDVEFGVFTGGNVTSDYYEGAGLKDWCIGNGTNCSTRPGYVKLGGGSAALGYLATPELSAIPNGVTATVTVKVSIMAYSNETTVYGSTILVGAIDNVVVGEKQQVSGWTTTSDNAVFLDSGTFDITGLNDKFYDFEVKLAGVTNTSRIRISSEPEASIAANKSRFLVQSFVVVVDALSNMPALSAPTNVKFDEDAIFSSSLTLNWDAVTGASSYLVKYWAEGDETNAVTESVTTNSITLYDLEASTTYYAQVMACSSAGEEFNSEYSDAVSCATNEVELETTPITVTLVNTRTSTLTFEWKVGEEGEDLTGEYNYNIALYRDEACTDLVVSWILDRTSAGYGSSVSGKLFDPYDVARYRFTFSGLDSGTDYWVTISADGDPTVSTETPFKATTTTFEYKVTAESNASAGDVIVAQDFHGLIDGGDLAYRAAATITLSSLRGTYTIPYGINPTNLAEPTNWDVEFGVFTGGNVTSDYYEAAGLKDWCIGNGTNCSTRPGYIKLGGGSAALGYLATPELSAIPDGVTASVTVKVSSMAYSNESTIYGSTILVGAIDNVVVGEKQQVSGWTTTSDDAEFLDSGTFSLKDINDDFHDFEVKLTGVTNTSRIRISSEPVDSKADNKSRFLVNSIVVVVDEITQ